MSFCSRILRQRASTSENASMIASLKRFSTDHSFLEPESFIGSWETPRDPKDGERKLAQLRRDYAKKVKVYRKEYIHEIEMLRVEKQQKDEARLLAERAANEERRRLKALAAKARAEERIIAQQEFAKTLMEERAEKLEVWRMMGKRNEEKKKGKEKLLCEQSSLWIEPNELEKKVTEALVDATTL